MTLNEKRKQPKQRVITGSIPTENHSTHLESQQRSTSSISSRFPSLLLTKQDQDDDRCSEYLPPRRSQPMPLASTYFGSGSNVGRGRPMTNDR